MPGVFVAGDVRARSIKRVASAVGEGSMAVSLIHEYLAERMSPAITVAELRPVDLFDDLDDASSRVGGGARARGASSPATCSSSRRDAAAACCCCSRARPQPSCSTDGRAEPRRRARARRRGWARSPSLTEGTLGVRMPADVAVRASALVPADDFLDLALAPPRRSTSAIMRADRSR